MVGEAWTVLAGKGAAFQDRNNPEPVFKVGAAGSQGIMEITDFVFTTIGPGAYSIHHLFCLVPHGNMITLIAAGAIVLEWNVKEPSGVQAGAGMWDSTIRCVLLDYKLTLSAKLNGLLLLILGSEEVGNLVMLLHVMFNCCFRCWNEPRRILVPVKR